MKTFTDGEILTASDLNANFAALGSLIQRGTKAGTALNNGAGETLTVTFPTAFAATPSVLVTSGNERLIVAVRNITKTGFSIGVRNDSGAAAASAPTHIWVAFA